MTTRDYTANVISATKVVPDGAFQNSAASGVWDINEALDLIKGGNWPTTGNFDPASFVDALFQTHIYDGAGSAQTITNNIDLTKGGLIWTKSRSHALGNALVDTENGVGKYLRSDSTAAIRTDSYAQEGVTAFNSNGYSLGNQANEDRFHRSGRNYVSWTFRKQSKFFDVLTYTGTGSAQNISHSLGSVPGMIIVKATSRVDGWAVYHRGVNAGTDPEDYIMLLANTNGQEDNANFWNDTAPTSTQFTVGTEDMVNKSGETYVAYLFAHHDDDGGFGEPGDQDIIKCGTYTGNAGNPQVINVGFEPQFLMVKVTGTTGDWQIVDNMRGVLPDGDYPCNNLYWNKTDAETLAGSFGFFANGFTAAQSSSTNGSGVTFMYMAIRRGGMQTPTSASDVFAISTANGGSSISTGFDADFALSGRRVDFPNWYLGTRLTGNTKYLHSDVANAEGTYDGWVWDSPSDTFEQNMNNTEVIDYLWARARGYFDAVTYSGTGSGSQNVSHNLGVVPEMMWIKVRNDADNWTVYHSALGNTKRLLLNGSDAVSSANNIFFNNTTPTSSVFTVDAIANGSYNYIAYLFATVSGVSKVGSFTQSGATNVDCGFTGSTPAFVLIKRTDASGDWVIFDSVRGIASGNDTSQALNSSDAEVSNTDLIDPYSGGFATTSSITNGSYIFYAIAAIS